MAATSPPVPKPERPNPLVRVLRLVFDVRVLGVLGQILAVVLVVLFFRWVATNTAANIDQLGESQFICRDGSSSFRCALDFLQSDAQFDIGEGPLDYDPSKSYWTAMAQGALNTLKVVAIGVVLTTILGTLAGIARLSNNWLVSTLARTYVDFFRNTPLIVQLFFIFFTVFAFLLPKLDEAIPLFGLPIYLSNRGINYPTLTLMSTAGIWFAFIVLGLIQGQVLWMYLRRQEDTTGRSFAKWPRVILSFLVVSIIGYAVARSWTSTHGIMSSVALRIRDFDDIDPLVRQRFGVNFTDEITGLIDNRLTLEEAVDAGRIRVGGERVTQEMLDDGTITYEQAAERYMSLEGLSSFDYLTEEQVDANALQVCTVRESKASLNFTARLDSIGIPYVLDAESRADRVTENYISGECEIFVGNLSMLAAERQVVELARASDGTIPTASAHNIVAITEPPVVTSIPRLQGLNFVGGGRLTTFFAAMLIGLVLNTGANVAEIVRAGIQAVSKGQTEAARALGLNEGQRLRLVILPQSLQVIIPPLISQYLNLAKNSTLGIAIGYSEFWLVSQTIINQSGRAIQVMVLIMAAFLSLSITISVFLNWYNSKVVIKER